jgi:Tfp pilus assembly protein PilN
LALSKPVDDKATQALSAPKPSLMSRLFTKKINQPPKGVTADHLRRGVLTNEPVELRRLAEDAPPVMQPRREEPAPEKPVMKVEPVKEQPIETPLPKIEPAKTEKKVVEKPNKEKKKWFSFGKKKPGKLHNAAPAQAEEGNGLDVNLIPSELVHQPEIDFKRRIVSGGFIIFTTLVVVAGLYLGMTWYQVQITQQISQFESEIKQLDTDIDRLEAEKEAALETQKKLALINNLINHHTYWTKFFEMLETHTSRNVYYTNFAMAGTESLTIAAVAKDYQTVAEQLVAFQSADDFVKNVRIDSASANINSETGTYDGASFNINLDFMPGIFTKQDQ